MHNEPKANTRASEAGPGDRMRSGQVVVMLLSYLVPLAIVVTFLAFFIFFRYRAESAAANFATLLPFGWAFAAGVVASVNPCGFFMLPAYLSYQLGTEDEGFYTSSALLRAGRALGLGLVATAGFVAIMSLVGAVIAAGGRWFVQVFPYAGVGIGVALTALGLWMLATKQTIGVLAARRVSVAPMRNLLNVFMFGTAYAVSSLSCTLPVFLLVVGNALTSRGLSGSLTQFVSYGLGMGSVLIVVTLSTALFRGTVVQSLRRLLPHVQRISALFLVGAGGYLIYYWIWLSGSIR